MNKTLKSSLVLTTLSLMLAGCGAGKNAMDSPTKENNGNSVQGDKDNSNIAVVINTNLGDKAFSDLVWSGITDVSKDLSLNSRAVELMGDATKQEPTLNELSEDGKYDVIVSGTFNLKEATQNAALKYPDQKFIVYDTVVDFDDADYSNVVSVMSKQNEGSFLAGFLAAKMTVEETEFTNDEKIIGFVGGGENSATNDFLIGYIEGAKYVDEETKVLYSYVGDFVNSAKAKELALSQYQQGADVVFAVAGSASLGVLDAAKEADKLAIGVDQDHALAMEDTDKEISEHVMTSILKNLDTILYEKVKEFEEGTIEWGKHEAAGLKENGMSVADNKYYQKIVNEDIRNEVKEVTQKIIDGEIEVSTAIGMSTEEVNEFRDGAK